ncbi:MAG: thiopeptide-type bacteriocin biosynthesis protein [Saprospiraceae bacterium]|nr:thiopeptide-type bacteriocin biosynthesis protein [Saprospiraceae bacterium]MDW8484099.1 thiopeptide-type bacteriocin biosynthesis protein [Saprospiraceae bacterium]
MEPRAWLSYHLYPLETLDVFLIRAVRPFLEQYVWPYQGARAFFIRYADERGFHIRLRLYGESSWKETVPQAVHEWFTGCKAIEEVAYQPNKEVFRSAEALYWGEEHFHLSSRVALERMRPPYTYGDALFDAMRLHVIAAYAAGWSREQASNYFNHLCERWALLFIQPAETNNGTPEQWIEDLKKLFEEHFRPQQEDLRFAVVELWKAIQKNRFDTHQPEWLRWLRGNELIFSKLGGGLESTLPTLIHLTNNRLGINNVDEPYLAYVLSKAL